MIAQENLSRRGALRWLVAIIFSVPAAQAETYPVPESSGQWLLRRVFRSRESAVVVGREFLRRNPEEADPERLAGLLGLQLTWRDPEAWDRWFIRCCRQDFRQDRMVEVGGWILALSEARLCALAAMLLGAQSHRH